MDEEEKEKERERREKERLKELRGVINYIYIFIYRFPKLSVQLVNQLFYQQI